MLRIINLAKPQELALTPREVAAALCQRLEVAFRVFIISYKLMAISSVVSVT